MKILAICGSPRKNGNSSLLLKELIRGAEEAGAKAETIIADETNIIPCRGCLRCNLLQKCATRDDEWDLLSKKILNANVIVFASPVYFHHLSAPSKKIIDHFRSFICVKLTETGLIHTPWHKWEKEFVLILSQGSIDAAESMPILDLFEFITETLGSGNHLTSIVGTRLAVARQVLMSRDELSRLYARLDLPIRLADVDYERNQQLLKKCHSLGRKLGKEKTND